MSCNDGNCEYGLVAVNKPNFLGDENQHLVYEEVHEPECPYP